jgi:hypothetical protein
MQDIQSTYSYYIFVFIFSTSKQTHGGSARGTCLIYVQKVAATVRPTH